MAMYGMNSGSAAALVLGDRALRKSERLPRALHVALKRPVDQFRHVWRAWSEVSKVLNTKGRKNRHMFFTSREEGANSLMQVTLVSIALNRKGKGSGKRQGTHHLQASSKSTSASG